MRYFVDIVPILHKANGDVIRYGATRYVIESDMEMVSYRNVAFVPNMTPVVGSYDYMAFEVTTISDVPAYRPMRVNDES